jgi:hypothetical protein
VHKWGIWGVIVLLFLPTYLAAQVCAEVKIEIPQVVSIERQAFVAKLGIENGVADPITQFSVDLDFKDVAGNAGEQADSEAKRIYGDVFVLAFEDRAGVANEGGATRYCASALTFGRNTNEVGSTVGVAAKITIGTDGAAGENDSKTCRRDCPCDLGAPIKRLCRGFEQSNSSGASTSERLQNSRELHLHHLSHGGKTEAFAGLSMARQQRSHRESLSVKRVLIAN